ncbi:PREDICTED: protein L-Myc-1b-like [Dufourea novaeangliae]|uniref:Myc proto-oncogene protein n=1 Tax=Dufourea novaeangliae TaxID=178035 RepID=A0A154PR69_DUFNO|nr:PREDICTED: protein L-Myc-1b-like [Dufourea novaeangliae]KZC13844.1 Myc proto-oncogene protein [Dufourea novaeangliae]
MPVPVWDCSDLGLLDEPLDTATVVSDDIWKKFDMDFPLDRVVDVHSDMYYERTFDDGVLPELLYDKMTCQESREIRHHDCMWAGLCISKEHNRTLPAKKDSQIQKRVPAGRSLLISRASAMPMTTTSLSAFNQQQAQQQYRAKGSESDGDSTRPETPQTSSSSDTETEDEGPFFRHDQINIHEKLSECMTEVAVKAVPVSEVTGQLVRFHDRRKEDDKGQCQVLKETNVRNTLSDHCYHLNQPIGKNLEHLGVQTPSDSEEEEIDVVTFEKPCRPAALPTYPSPADQQHFQLTVNTAFKDKAPAPRPRGRPPSNPARKRTAQPDHKPAKRARHRPYQRRNKVGRCMNTTITTTTTTTTITTPSTPMKITAPTLSRSSSDDELDTEKRSLHNNMERQRRIELRNAFEELRVLVPAVESKEKAPKVAILRQAAVYCDMLTEIGQITVAKVTELRRRQEKLRARLSQLRRSLAMTR